MKRNLGVLIAVLLLVLAGCGVKEKIGDKVTEKITEGIAEKVGGEDVDIDLDDGKISIKDKDGKEWSAGGDEWPQDAAASQIPEFKKGTITGVINSTENCWIEIQDVDEADFQDYVETLKNTGFDKNATNYTDEESLIYSAYREENILVTVTYSSDNTMVIQVIISSR